MAGCTTLAQARDVCLFMSAGSMVLAGNASLMAAPPTHAAVGAHIAANMVVVGFRLRLPKTTRWLPHDALLVIRMVFWLLVCSSDGNPDFFP